MPTNTPQRLLRWSIFDRVDGLHLGLFRAIFGLLMLWEMIFLIRLDFVQHFLIAPEVLFPYELTAWIPLMPTAMLKILIYVLAACSVLIALGWLYRPAIVIFAIGFTYLFVLDKAYYNNHLYLVCLLAGLLCFIPADSALALRRRRPTSAPFIPRWGLLILQVQIALVFFFGGIAKLNSSWLFDHQPAKILLAARAQDSGMSDLLTSETAVWIIVYGGLIFDLAVGFLLFWRRTLFPTIVAAIAFNLINSWLFNDINIFPYLMLASLFLYVDPDFTRRRFRLSQPLAESANSPAAPSHLRRRWIVALLSIYLTLQVLLPLRHLLIPGPVDWTGEGQRFSWRMKIQHRKIHAMNFMIWDFDSRTQFPVTILDLEGFGLNRDQLVQMAEHPEMTVPLSRFLAREHVKKYGSSRVEVRVNIQIEFNGRPNQQLIDPEADMATASVKLFAHNDWIVPLRE